MRCQSERSSLCEHSPLCGHSLKALAVIPRGFPKAFFVCSREGRVILKAAGIAYFRDRRAGGDQLFGEKQPLSEQIAADGVAGLLLERVHQVGAA